MASVEDPLPSLLWDTLRAVPVIPVQPNLRPLSVLVRENGAFWVIGDLASLCLQRERAFLENAIAQTNYSVTDLEEINTIMRRSSPWLSRLFVWLTGGASESNNVHQWRVHIPSHQSVSIEDDVFTRMTDNLFVPDRGNPYFSRGRTRDVWVVKEVISAPSLSVYALDRTGANIRVAVPPIPPVPLSVKVDLGGEVGNEFFSRITGPVGVDGQVQALPFAFRGFKFKYENGFFRRPTPARYQSELHQMDGGAPDAEPFSYVDHATPWDDPDMSDFVNGDEWFTTIKVPTPTASATGPPAGALRRSI